MKKLAILILSIVLFCGMLAGCGNDLMLSVSDNGITDYDAEDITDGFELKWKEYYYSGNPRSSVPAGNVIILNATNTTETNYSAKIRVTFFDESGEEVGKETKNIRDFPAGHSRDVIWWSCPDYSTYSTELELTEYTGDSYVEHISIKFGTQTKEFLVDPADPNSAKYSELVARTSLIFDCPIPKMYVSYDVALFDNKEEIYIIYEVAKTVFPQSECGYVCYSANQFLKDADINKRLELPPELTGDVLVIFSMDNIKVYN